MCVCVCIYIYIYIYIYNIYIYDDDFSIPFIKHKPVTEGHSLINGQVFENHAVVSCTLQSVSRKVGL